MFGLDLEKKPVEEVDEVSERADDVTHLFCNYCFPGLQGKPVVRVAFCGGKYQSLGIPAAGLSCGCPMCMEMRPLHMHGIP